jgi:hypothetical protein
MGTHKVSHSVVRSKLGSIVRRRPNWRPCAKSAENVYKWPINSNWIEILPQLKCNWIVRQQRKGLLLARMLVPRRLRSPPASRRPTRSDLLWHRRPNKGHRKKHDKLSSWHSSR